MRCLLIFGIAILYLVSCADPATTLELIRGTGANREAQNEASEEDVSEYYVPPNWSDDFDWRLLKEFRSKSHRNVIISPISIKIVLALLYSGSAGNTKAEFEKVLQYPENNTLVDRKYKNIIKALKYPSKDYELSLGTRVFLEPSFKPRQKFQSNAEAVYDAMIVPTNFSDTRQASEAINRWAENITRGHIKRLVHGDELKEKIMLVANAIYFKGRWLRQFPKRDTHQGGFYRSPTDIVDVDYMAVSDKFYYSDSKQLGAKIVRVPYTGSRFVMYFILPHYKDGLDDLLERLNADLLRRHLNLTDLTHVNMILPKFKFDFQTELSTVLQDMGLKSMFQFSASFPGIVRDEAVNLMVSDVVQKAGIEISEEGTVAFAATDVQVVNKFGDVQGVFNATHPFLFFIEDRINNEILFVGKVENPLQADPNPLKPSYEASPQSSVPISANLEPQFVQPVHPILPPRIRTTTPPAFHLQPQSPSTPQYEDKKRFGYLDFELLQAVSSNENVFISPASIKATLAMLLEGAGGQTAEEIKIALRVNNVKESRELIQDILYSINQRMSRSTLESGQALFVSDKYENNEALTVYKQILSNYYQALVQVVPFSNPIAASNYVNAWVSNITRGLIPDIIKPDNFDINAGLVIANALFFSGDWLNAFDEKLTAPKCFNTPTKGCVYVDMMQITETFKYNVIDDIDAHAVELPYSDNTYSMLLLISRNNNNVALLRNLLHASLNRIIRELETTDIVLHMPKFEIDYTADMVEALQKVKVTEIFKRTANLTGIISNREINVDALVQRAVVRVTESGTIAAAASAASVIPLMGSSAPKIVADHPFIFIIYNKHTEHILFEGIVNEPTHSASRPPSNANVPQRQRQLQRSSVAANNQRASPQQFSGRAFQNPQAQ